MTVRLTPSEFRTLVRLVWLGQKVVQGGYQADETPIHDVRKLQKALFAQKGPFGADDLFDPTSPPQDWVLNSSEEDVLHSLKEFSEEDAFWEILVQRLVLRDITEERTEAQWNWLPEDEKNRIYEEKEALYNDEFWEYGIVNLRLATDDERRALPDWDPFDPVVPPELSGPGGDEAEPPRGKIISFPQRPTKPRD